jgi:hypothetical protein
MPLRESHPASRGLASAPRRRRSCLLVLLLCLPLGATFAQEITGSIEGTVLAPDGQPLPGVVVVATHSATQVARRALTNRDGGFRFGTLPLGEYALTIDEPDFDPVSVRPVLVRLGRTTALPPLRLSPRGRFVERVDVVATPPLIDPVSTTAGGSISAPLFDNLPVQRDYRSIAALLPSVSPSFLGDGLNIGGATGFENRYFLDGIDMTDPGRGATGTMLPPDFIQEVEVKTGGYEAQYRSALGGVLNVVTPSGSNVFAGKFIGYWTSYLVSADAKQSSLQLQTRDFAQYDAGFSLSGPLVRDHAWFFVAYDPEVTSVETELPDLGYYEDSTTTQRFAAKADWQIDGANRLALTVVGDPSRRDAVGDLQAGFPVAPKHFLNPDPYLRRFEDGGMGASLRGTHALGPDVLLESELSNLWRRYTNLPLTERGRREPGFIDAVTGTWSGGSPFEMAWRNSQLTAALKATWALENHEVKAGAEYRQNRESVSTNKSDNITYYADGSYSTFYGDQPGSPTARVPSLFVQDSWRIGSRWTLNLGLRWAREIFIDESGRVNQTIENEWQPRLGFVYQPGRLGTQRIYGSAARYYQEVAGWALTAWQAATVFLDTCTYDHDPRVDPSGGDCNSFYIPVQAEVAGLHGNYYDDYALGYQVQFGGRHRAGVRAVYRTLGDALEDGVVPATGQLTWGNPGRGPLAGDFPRPSRVYKALEFTVEGQPDGRSGYLASYVLSENRGNYPGLYNTDQKWPWPNANISYDLPESMVGAEGLLPNDRTHVFKVSGFYQFEFGLNAGASLLWESGTPLNRFGGASYGPPWLIFLQQRGTAGRTPSIFDLSLRLDYTFRLRSASRWKPRLILDVYHLFSGRKAVDYDQVHSFRQDADGNQVNPNPTYGQVLRFYPPATARLGFEVSF